MDAVASEEEASKLRWQARRRLGKGKYSERTKSTYDNDGRGKVVRLRLLLLADVIVEARALSPQKQTGVK